MKKEPDPKEAVIIFVLVMTLGTIVILFCVFGLGWSLW